MSSSKVQQGVHILYFRESISSKFSHSLLPTSSSILLLINKHSPIIIQVDGVGGGGGMDDTCGMMYFRLEYWLRGRIHKGCKGSNYFNGRFVLSGFNPPTVQ